MVVPSLSIVAEPSVALVEKNAKRHGTLEVAQAYLEYLSSDEGQDIAAKHYYRPFSTAVAAKYAQQFSTLELFRFEEQFGSWPVVQKTHFDDKGVFDQIYQPR